MASLCFLTIMILIPASASSTPPNPQLIQSSRVLDLVVRDYTLKSFKRHSIKTGIIHTINLPANLSGIKVDTVRYRCGSLHRYGANVKEFHVGIGSTVQPCAERVILVRQNLGMNWSLMYYTNFNLSGYDLVTPVLGLLAYNANGDSRFTNSSAVNLVAGRNPIAVDFSNITRLNQKLFRKPKCVSFGDDGRIELTDEFSPFVCIARNQGHFALAIQSMTTQPAQIDEQRKIKRWKLVIGSFVGSVIGVFLLGLLVVAVFVKVKKKKVEREKTARRAYEEEALQVSMVGHIRALTAEATRTLPKSMQQECIPN